MENQVSMTMTSVRNVVFGRHGFAPMPRKPRHTSVQMSLGHADHFAFVNDSAPAGSAAA